MPAPNVQPIYSRQGDIDGGVVLTTAAADYTGQNVNNQLVYSADPTNGGFIQKLRFKALGTNVATVARIYLVSANDNLVTVLAAVSGTPTGTPSTTGGTMPAGPWYAKIYATDAYGKVNVASTETALVTTTAVGTNSIAWAWTAVAGAISYIVYVGQVAGGERQMFTTNTNSFTQTTALANENTPINEGANNFFYGEVSLPATTASAAAATADIDYPLNIALSPGMNVYVGLGTTVAAGWSVASIAGVY